MTPSFWQWYHGEYYKVWYDFADNFHKGAEAYQTETARRNMAVLMGTDRNPYWKLISRMSVELTLPDSKTKPPKWAELPTELVNIAMLSGAGDKKAAKNESLVTRIGERLKNGDRPR